MLFAHAICLHTALFVTRPAISYRALDLGLAPAWIGALGATFALVPLVLALQVGRVVDRRGEQPPMLLGAGLVVLGVVGFLTLGWSVAGLVVASAVFGFGHLLSVVTEQAQVANLHRSSGYDSAFGYFSLAASFGQLIGPGLLAALVGDSTSPDVTPVFTAAAAASGLVLALSALLPSNRWADPGTTPATTLRALRAVVTIPGFAPAVLASLMAISTVDILAVYLPVWGHERGVPAALVGAVLTVRAAASMASRGLLGWLVGRYGRHRLLIASAVASAVGVAALPVSTALVVVLPAAAIAGWGLGVIQPVTMAWLAQASPVDVRATAMAVRISGNRLGQTLVPAVVGTVAAGAGAAGVLWATAGALGLMTATVRRSDDSAQRPEPRGHGVG